MALFRHMVLFQQNSGLFISNGFRSVFAFQGGFLPPRLATGFADGINAVVVFLRLLDFFHREK